MGKWFIEENTDTISIPQYFLISTMWNKTFTAFKVQFNLPNLQTQKFWFKIPST